MLDRLQVVVSLHPGIRVTLLCPRQSGREFVEGKPGQTLAGTFSVSMQDFHDRMAASPLTPRYLSLGTVALHLFWSYRHGDVWFGAVWTVPRLLSGLPT